MDGYNNDLFNVHNNRQGPESLCNIATTCYV